MKKTKNNDQLLQSKLQIDDQDFLRIARETAEEKSKLADLMRKIAEENK